MKPRVLVVDDHELVRKGLALLLEPDWEICGEAENGKEAIRKAQQLKPDLVILDIVMPVMGGTTAAREIRRVAPATKIVLLSMHEPVTVQELGKLGRVDACLTKDCSAERLRNTLSAFRPAD